MNINMLNKSSVIILLTLSSLTQLAAQKKLIWSDEFDGAGLADSTKWTYEEGLVRNNEAQYYTKANTNNARLENGNASN